MNELIEAHNAAAAKVVLLANQLGPDHPDVKVAAEASRQAERQLFEAAMAAAKES